MAGNINRIPVALTAKNHVDLMKAMLKNNLSNSKEYTYTIIHASGTWYAWYNADITEGNINVKTR